jgi:serine/threonine protein kinase/TolB-like protein
VEIVRQATRGLAHIHKNGIVHRDVKPENLLVSTDGRILLSDFGIAFSADCTRLTQSGMIVGTPNYMAPEQWERSRSVDGRADIYALGVVLYQLSTGQVPFTAPNTPALGVLHQTEPPKPPSSFVNDFSLELEEVILRALEKDPDARFQSAEDFQHALQAVRVALENNPTGTLESVGLWAQSMAATGSGTPTVASAEIPDLPPDTDTVNSYVGEASSRTSLAEEIGEDETVLDQSVEVPAGDSAAAGSTSKPDEANLTNPLPVEEVHREMHQAEVVELQPSGTPSGTGAQLAPSSAIPSKTPNESAPDMASQSPPMQSPLTASAAAPSAPPVSPQHGVQTSAPNENKGLSLPTVAAVFILLLALVGAGGYYIGQQGDAASAAAPTSGSDQLAMAANPTTEEAAELGNNSTVEAPNVASKASTIQNTSPDSTVQNLNDTSLPAIDTKSEKEPIKVAAAPPTPESVALGSPEKKESESEQNQEDKEASESQSRTIKKRILTPQTEVNTSESVIIDESDTQRQLKDEREAKMAEAVLKTAQEAVSTPSEPVIDNQPKASRVATTPKAAPKEKPTIAIPAFEIRGQRIGSNVGADFAEELATYFPLQHFRLIERSHMKTLLQEQQLQASDLVKEEGRKAEFGKFEGVEYLVVGTVSENMGRYQISARIVHVESGDIKALRKYEGVSPRALQALLPQLAIDLQADSGFVTQPGASTTMSMSGTASVPLVAPVSVAPNMGEARPSPAMTAQFSKNYKLSRDELKKLLRKHGAPSVAATLSSQQAMLLSKYLVQNEETALELFMADLTPIQRDRVDPALAAIKQEIEPVNVSASSFFTMLENLVPESDGAEYQGAGLEVEYTIYYNRRNIDGTFNSGMPMPDGAIISAPRYPADQSGYWFTVRPSRNAHIYIIQVDTGGKVQVLWPRNDNFIWANDPINFPAGYGSNPIPGGQMTRVPNTSFLQLDDRTGIETIFMVACLEPRSQREITELERFEGRLLEWQAMTSKTDVMFSTPNVIDTSMMGPRTRGAAGAAGGASNPMYYAQPMEAAPVNEKFSTNSGRMIVRRWFRHVE